MMKMKLKSLIYKLRDFKKNIMKQDMNQKKKVHKKTNFNNKMNPKIKILIN